MRSGFSWRLKVAIVALVLAAGYGCWNWLWQPEPSALSREAAGHLEAVREHLRRNEVTRARDALDRVLVVDARNKEAQRLNDEVTTRESQRNSALKATKECLRSNDLPCAMTKAKSALTADATSDEARQIVERLNQMEKVPSRRSIPVPPTAAPELPPRPAPKLPPVAPPRVPPKGDQSECDSITSAGRRALEARRYDDAINSANALSALGFCPGAQQLKQDALRAKEEARR